MTYISFLKKILDIRFNIKDLWNLKYFLGFEVARSNQGIFICQRKNSLEILQDTRMLGAKPTITPMDSNHKLDTESNSATLSNPTSFHTLIRKMLYLIDTRPDISFAVESVSLKNHKCSPSSCTKNTSVHQVKTYQRTIF